MVAPAAYIAPDSLANARKGRCADELGSGNACVLLKNADEMKKENAIN